MSVSRFINELKLDEQFSEWIVHHEVIPGKDSDWEDFPDSLAPELRAGLEKTGIRRLYSHQALAFRLAQEGKDIVVVTPTASGKTLCYNLPALNRMISSPESRGLYVFPIKALEQDQRNTLLQLVESSGLKNRITAEIYDGDTPQSQRAKILRQPPSVIITNPDMLHRSILGFHPKWEQFLKGLEFIVLDELHTYRGVFGSHIVQVLKRLFRVTEFYGRSLQVIASSATIANPGELASALTGRSFSVIDQNGAARSRRHFLFINPEQLSTYTVAARLFKRSLELGLKTIAFTKARKITELIYTWMMQSAPGLSGKISAYRAGYLPEERREIERRLFSGELLGVISTSALEMGIDIGELDVCILVGYPGTVTQTWQRGGRVGRKERESVIALVSMQNALDQYFMKHPQAFFKSEYEAAVVDPMNRPILKAHIECAASELPVRPDDKYFPEAKSPELFQELKNEGRLVQTVSDKSYVARRKRPQLDVDIRSIGDSWTIFVPPKDLDAGKGMVVGSMGGHRVFSDCHPGAIYLHRGRQYEIERLDAEKKDVYVRPVEVNYYTQSLSKKDTEILKVVSSRPVKNFIARFGELRVHEQIIGYQKKHFSSQERLSVHDLELPEQVFETMGFWIEIDGFIAGTVVNEGLHFMGGIHALEHAAIGLFPLFAFCDRDDVGGISIPLHPQVGKAAVFIYDGYPGGIGLCERCYASLEQLLDRTLDMVGACDCETGCPACIQSPKCGNGNVPLDKDAALLILQMLLNKPEARKFLEASAAASEETAPVAETPVPAAGQKARARVLVFDLETKRGAQEVGGWGNCHLMGMALAVVWDSVEQKSITFQEAEVNALIDKLKTGDLVVGFNHTRFDYTVLSAYTDFDFSSLPNFDILGDIYQRLGMRLSLDHLAQKTLGRPKTASGLESLQWVKQGRFDLVEKYCRMDVELTRDLFYYGLEKRRLVFAGNGGELLELSVDWELEKIVNEAKCGAGRPLPRR